mmetsp:Transcript_11300/g.15542  ORF Transcript_11300/g.15542 Transcript_11300/m.15542 type:complete len:86 (-) Transcript_11300:1915-2172(-)
MSVSPQAFGLWKIDLNSLLLNNILRKVQHATSNMWSDETQLYRVSLYISLTIYRVEAHLVLLKNILKSSVHRLGLLVPFYTSKHC